MEIHPCVVLLDRTMLTTDEEKQSCSVCGSYVGQKSVTMTTPQLSLFRQHLKAANDNEKEDKLCSTCSFSICAVIALQKEVAKLNIEIAKILNLLRLKFITRKSPKLKPDSVNDNNKNSVQKNSAATTIITNHDHFKTTDVKTTRSLSEDSSPVVYGKKSIPLPIPTTTMGRPPSRKRRIKQGQDPFKSEPLLLPKLEPALYGYQVMNQEEVTSTNSTGGTELVVPNVDVDMVEHADCPTSEAISVTYFCPTSEMNKYLPVQATLTPSLPIPTEESDSHPPQFNNDQIYYLSGEENLNLYGQFPQFDSFLQTAVEPESESMVIKVDPFSTYNVDPNWNTQTETIDPLSVPLFTREQFIPGTEAVCHHCGTISRDLHFCEYCKIRLPNDVKLVVKGKKQPTPPIEAICGVCGHVEYDPETLISVPAFCSYCKTPKKQTNDEVTNNIDNTSSKSNKVENITGNANSKSETKSKEVVALMESSVSLFQNKDGRSRLIHPVSRNKGYNEPISVDTSSDSEEECEASGKPGSSSSTKILTRKMKVTKPSTKVTIGCRAIRIGTYESIATYPVIITKKAIIFNVMHPRKKSTPVIIRIPVADVVYAEVHVHSSLPVIFLVLRGRPYAAHIRDILEISNQPLSADYCYDPTKGGMSQRRIAFLSTTGLLDKFEDICKVFPMQILVRIPKSQARAICQNFEENKKKLRGILQP